MLDDVMRFLADLLSDLLPPIVSEYREKTRCRRCERSGGQQKVCSASCVNCKTTYSSNRKADGTAPSACPEKE